MDEHLLQTHDGESGLAVSSILGKEKYKIKGTLQIFTPWKLRGIWELRDPCRENLHYIYGKGL